MALKETNKNRKKISVIEAKVELYNHEQETEHQLPVLEKKNNHKLFFSVLGLIALIAFFVV